MIWSGNLEIQMGACGLKAAHLRFRVRSGRPVGLLLAWGAGLLVFEEEVGLQLQYSRDPARRTDTVSTR